jgi:hypothetical protein
MYDRAMCMPLLDAVVSEERGVEPTPGFNCPFAIRLLDCLGQVLYLNVHHGLYIYIYVMDCLGQVPYIQAHTLTKCLGLSLCVSVCAGSGNRYGHGRGEGGVAGRCKRGH